MLLESVGRLGYSRDRVKIYMTYHFNQRKKYLQAIRAIVFGRWFLIFSLALFAAVQYVLTLQIFPVTVQEIFLIGVIPIIYNTIFTFYIIRPATRLSNRALQSLSFSQIFIDQLAVTALIYLTGGPDSIAYVLYFFSLFATTILFSEAEIVSLTILSLVMYITLIMLEFTETIPHYDRYSGQMGSTDFVISNTIFFSIALISTALFAVFINRLIRERELELTIERDKIRSIINSLEDGIVMLDANGHVLLINTAARDMLLLYGKAYTTHLPKEHMPAFLHSVVDVLLKQQQKKRFGEEVLIEKLDDRRHLQIDSIPITTKEGKAIGWVKVLRDVTREKELDSIKSDFISVAAHQLRTPLAGLKWFFKIMQEGDAGRVTKRQAELLEEAYLRNNEVIEIVNNLLDISEIEEGRFPYTFEANDLVTVIESTIEGAGTEWKRKNIEIKFDNAVGTDSIMVEMDAQKMKMAIQNLVDNAVKYSSPDSTVWIKLRLKNGRYILSIVDHGIGIAKEQQQNIFTKFFRGTNAKEWITTGSGLGLYIVKNIIGKHHGQIWFQSEEGEGTTFFISFPQYQADSISEYSTDKFA